MQNWDIQASTFDQGFILVDYPSTSSTIELVISDVIFSAACNIQYAKMFLIRGGVTAENLVLNNFVVKGGTSIGDADTNKAADSIFLELSGLFNSI